MKTILSLRRHHYLKTVGIFLIAAVLIAGVVSCNGGADTYALTMAVNPAGTGIATDETGGSPYEENAAVNISAVAASCYRFVGWTSSAGGTFDDPNAATTNFTMPDQDVTVTANFELKPLDHFRVYDVDYETAPSPDKEVELVDQFGAINATVAEAAYFGNPVKKEKGTKVTPISDPNNHYTFYMLEFEEWPEEQYLQVTVKNQFGDNQVLIVSSIPYLLGVPTQKLSPEEHDPWDCLDHFLVYPVMPGGDSTVASVNLEDQFGAPEQGVDVYSPKYFANPVKKTCDGKLTDIENPNVKNHLVFYVTDMKEVSEEVAVSNQFDPGKQQVFNVDGSDLLAVPSQKISWEQPLDHFKSYWAAWPEGPSPPGFPVDVQLKDQWVTINATVDKPWLFANPVEKWLNEVEWTPIFNWNNHLTFYDIGYDADPQSWEVTVTNQFGINQLLLVGGPFYLAVPTGKLAPEWPEDLDHFLVYDVIGYDYQYGEVEVYLWDQFDVGQYTYVHEPEFFAIPVQKTIVGSGEVTEIKGDEHLVFYGIDGGMGKWFGLPVVNQFGLQFLDVWQGEDDYLGVPSEKKGSAGPYPYPG